MFKLTVTIFAVLLSFTASAATLKIENPTVVSIDNGKSAIQGEWQSPLISSNSYSQNIESLVANKLFTLSLDLTVDAPSILTFDFLGSTIAGGVSLINHGTNAVVLQKVWQDFDFIKGLTGGMEANVLYKLIIQSYMYDGSDLGRDFTLSLSNIEVSEVPLPAAVWLFGSVLLGGLALRRKRRLSQLA